jgi:hypothetical protein
VAVAAEELGMTDVVARAFAELEPDEWREREPFSEDLHGPLRIVCAEGSPRAERLSAINAWMARRQPCLFGRIAAKSNAITYGLLSESDLRGSDGDIRELIESARLEWTQRGFAGRSSGFVILVASETLARARPSEAVKRIALRLATLYLEREVQSDTIELEEIWLEKLGAEAWKWPAGVNYFSAQGDRRWWHDHRIPAGMAFSVNSVGHMVKAGLLRSLGDLDASELDGEKLHQTQIDSLEKALEMAMRTIHNAADAVSGKATFLVDTILGEGRPRCPVDLPRPIQGKDTCEYRGWYHTDYTVPSEYFLEQPDRQKSVQLHNLDFTYLFDDRLDNPDYRLTGKGRRIRAAEMNAAGVSAVAVETQKRRRGIPETTRIEDSPRLRRALGR